MNRYKFLLDRVATDVFAWPRGPQHPPLFYVTIYKVTRCYGGPEEGGWDYDHTDYLSSCPVRDLHYAAELIEALEAEPSLQKQPKPYPVSPMHGDPFDLMNDSDDWTPRGADGDVRYEFSIEVMPDHPNLTHYRNNLERVSFYDDGDRRFYTVGWRQSPAGVPRYE